FRFHLAVDTLVLGSWFRLLRPIVDFHHLVNTHAGRTVRTIINPCRANHRSILSPPPCREG
ncbi:hypothetical protein, partial [Limosilactobacillus reuteri]|uniref:hypothetical protein n=1 Tax=Limosilactobacillus reuteri TaxID=1598 RepID=UPI001C3F74BB